MCYNYFAYVTEENTCWDDEAMNSTSKTNYHRSLTLKAAWYYYIDNLTQQQIADILDISRMKVVKLIDKSKEEHIVQFDFPTISSSQIALENGLIRKYHLKDALVVPSSGKANQITSVASAAAMYLNDRIHGESYINLGYGETVSHVINELAAIASKTVSFISLTGGVTPYLPQNTTTRFNANLYIIPSPIIMSSPNLAQAMLTEPDIQQILRMNKLAQYTVISVGGVDSNATAVQENLISANDFMGLKMSGAQGDILLHFFNQDGKQIESQINDRLVGISIKELKELNNVVGVAAGESKVEAIRAALKGGYLDIIITDEATAANILEDKEE